MARPHIPDLVNIRALESDEIKFYAVIGAAVSLTAGLELALFDVFEKATGLGHIIAAKIFYGTQNTGARRDIALTTMGEKLASAHTMPAEWDILKGRIVSATGQSAVRHLVAHNVVHMNTTIEFGRSQQGEAFGPLGQEKFTSTRSEFSVSQDGLQVLAANRKPNKADFEALFSFCENVLTLLNDLDIFLARVGP